MNILTSLFISKKIALIKFLILIFLLFNFNIAVALTDNSVSYSFIALSDIHFDPFSGCKRTSKICDQIIVLNKIPSENWHDFLTKGENNNYFFGKDTNIVLWNSTLFALKQSNKEFHPKFVIVLGDILAHHYKKLYVKFSQDRTQQGYKQFVEKTIKFIYSDLKKALPNMNIYFVIGNNDSFVRDYYVDKEDFYHSLSHILLPSLQTSKQQDIQTFMLGGYYKTITPQNLKIIALNTNPFSKKAKKNDDKIIALKELSWLKTEVNNNNKQKIILLMHIPDGLNLFINNKYLFRIFDFWQSSYIQQYEKILENATDVSAVFSAHVHYGWQGIKYYNKKQPVILFGVPSISQYYGNKSAFNIYFFSNNNEFLRVMTYKMLSQETWKAN